MDCIFTLQTKSALAFVWKEEFKRQPFEPVGKPKDSTGGKNKHIPKVATRNSLHERILRFMAHFLQTNSSKPLEQANPHISHYYYRREKKRRVQEFSQFFGGTFTDLGENGR